jgi:hypothetical protein
MWSQSSINNQWCRVKIGRIKMRRSRVWTLVFTCAHKIWIREHGEREHRGSGRWHGIQTPMPWPTSSSTTMPPSSRWYHPSDWWTRFGPARRPSTSSGAQCLYPTTRLLPGGACYYLKWCSDGLDPVNAVPVQHQARMIYFEFLVAGQPQGGARPSTLSGAQPSTVQSSAS